MRMIWAEFRSWKLIKHHIASAHWQKHAAINVDTFSHFKTTENTNICFLNNAMRSPKKTQAHVKTSIHTESQIHTLAIYTARWHTGGERVIRGFDHQRWQSFFAVSDLWHNVLQRRHQSPMKPRRHPWSMTPAAKSKATEYEQRVMMASNHIPGSPAQASNTIKKEAGSAC